MPTLHPPRSTPQAVARGPRRAPGASAAGRRRAFVEAAVGLPEDPARFLRRCLAACVAVEVVLVLLHLGAWHLGGLAGLAVDGHIGGFDLGDEATLAVWFSSFQLLVVALLCRMCAWASPGCGPLPWGLGAFLFLIMAVDETGGLHEVFGKGMARVLPGVPLAARTWWVLPYAAGIGLFVLGALRELRGELPARCGVVLGPGCWAAAVLVDHVDPSTRAWNLALEEGLEMLGATLLVGAIGMHLLRVTRGGAGSSPGEAPAPGG